MQQITYFQILNFSFLKIHSSITSLIIDKFKLKNYIKLNPFVSRLLGCNPFVGRL